MGRKSKKSMANKLAKMSDEERAKYMQRKADAEEEIKRRREQLIATFIKNKLKKEEGFGRLNLAKINQHWHQLLRQQKCKQMKEQVGHLKKWVARVYKLKENTIRNLIDELEEAEIQLQNNFQAHVIRIDQLIGKHDEYLKKMHNQYEKDRDELMETFLAEKKITMERSVENAEFLKCLIYGNNETLKKIMKENKEIHVEKLTSIIADYHIEHEEMEKELKTICCSVAKQLSNLTKRNFKETDPKRIHYQGLLKFDRESTTIINIQSNCIKQKENLLKRIEKRYSELREAQKKQLQAEQRQLHFFKDCLFSMRKGMLSDIKLDENRRILLIDSSNNVIKYLEKIAYKGQQILQLAQNCQSLETESDKISRWQYFLFRQENTTDDLDDKQDDIINSNNDNLYEDSEIETEEKMFTEDEYYFRKINMLHSPFQKGETNLEEFDQLNTTENENENEKIMSMSPYLSIKSNSDFLPPTSQSLINKTGERTIIKKELLFSTRSYSDTIPTTLSMIKRIELVGHAKKSNSAPASLIINRKANETNSRNKLDDETSSSTIRILNEFKSLKGMENFWTIYNKLEIDHIRFKKEKFILLEENKLLKSKLLLLLQADEISSAS